LIQEPVALLALAPAALAVSDSGLRAQLHIPVRWCFCPSRFEEECS